MRASTLATYCYGCLLSALSRFLPRTDPELVPGRALPPLAGLDHTKQENIGMLTSYLLPSATYLSRGYLWPEPRREDVSLGAIGAKVTVLAAEKFILPSISVIAHYTLQFMNIHMEYSYSYLYSA